MPKCLMSKSAKATRMAMIASLARIGIGNQKYWE
jgi:hypothetical protein